MEDKIKKYVENGGKLFTVTSIETIRDGGTKMIRCINSDNFYLDKNLNEFHSSYPLTDENKINDELLKTYILERIKTCVERLGEEYERNMELLKKLNIK